MTAGCVFTSQDFKEIHANCQPLALHLRHIGYKSREEIQVYTDVYAVHEMRSGGRGVDGVLLQAAPRED